MDLLRFKVTVLLFAPLNMGHPSNFFFLLLIGAASRTAWGNHPESPGCMDIDAKCALVQEVKDGGQVHKMKSKCRVAE